MVGPFVVPMKLSCKGSKISFRVNLRQNGGGALPANGQESQPPDEEVGNILARDEIVNIIDKLNNASQSAVDQYTSDVLKYQWFLARLLTIFVLSNWLGYSCRRNGCHSRCQG